MKQRRPVRIFVVAAIATATLVWTTQFILAQAMPATRIAKTYYAWLSRAMDECVTPVVSVTGAKLPAGGCLQANANTDTDVTMTYGYLKVGRAGKVTLVMKGATVGDKVDVVLTLRVSQTSVKTTKGNKNVTFPDTTVTCGPFTAGARGLVVQSAMLGACLGSSLSSLAAGNVEILSATVVNDSTGLAIATGGILR